MIELFLKAVITFLLVALIWQQTKRVSELERQLRLNVIEEENTIKIIEAARHLILTLEFEGKAELLAVKSLARLISPDQPRSYVRVKNV